MGTGEQSRVGDTEKLEVDAVQDPLPREWYHPHGMSLFLHQLTRQFPTTYAQTYMFYLIHH